jgi:hypothetical protein
MHSPGVTERRVRIGLALQIQRPELLEVGSQHLIGIDVDDLLNVKREQHVQEENLVAPNDALLLGLLGEPFGPLVGHVSDL